MNLYISNVINLRKTRLFLSLTAALLLSPHLVSAEVNLKNGNFYISYLDLEYSAGIEPKIQRVFNSKSGFRGIFGWGWGNEFEVFLTPSPDGSVVVHEFGGGNAPRYIPADYNEAEIKKSVNMLVGVAKSEGILGTPEQLAHYQKKLTDDVELRNSEWEKYAKQGKVKPRVVATGTQLRSIPFKYLFLTKVAGGYLRKYTTGRTEYFSESGRLLKTTDQFGNYIEFKYLKDGHLEKMVDNLSRKIFFTFNNKGLATKIEGEDGKVITYEYNELDELKGVTILKGPRLNYEYDKQKHHNLTKITHDGKVFNQIEYYGDDKRQNVKKLIDDRSYVTTYEYPPLSGGYAVSMKTFYGNKVINTTEFQYYTKTKLDGSEFTYRLVANMAGVQTDTQYEEKCGLPSSITRDGKTTSFIFDDKCRLTQKTSASEVIVVTYHPTGKVTSVVKTPAGSDPAAQKKGQVWSKFDYDAQGNLKYAESSDRRKVALVYDTRGRIKSMMDQNKRQISFEYDEASKPVKIIDSKLGILSIEYNKTGEVVKRNNPTGQDIEAQATAAYQNLQSIAALTNVPLTF